MPLWTPYRVVLLNRVLRRLLPGRNVSTPWLYGRRWHWLRDDRKSETLEIVYRETVGGQYAPRVLLGPGDAVLDLGAHVGGFTIPLAAANPGVRFVCYEPDRRNHSNLVRNVERAGLRNVTCVRAGVWGTRTPLASTHHRFNTGGSSSKPVPAGQRLEAWGYTLQEIRERHNLSRLSLLKMDVEGAEFSAIRSASDLAGIDSALIEVHGGQGDAAALCKLITTAVPRTCLQVLPSDGHPFVLEDGQNYTPRNLDGRIPA